MLFKVVSMKKKALINVKDAIKLKLITTHIEVHELNKNHKVPTDLYDKLLNDLRDFRTHGFIQWCFPVVMPPENNLNNNKFRLKKRRTRRRQKIFCSVFMLFLRG